LYTTIFLCLGGKPIKRISLRNHAFVRTKLEVIVIGEEND